MFSYLVNVHLSDICPFLGGQPSWFKKFSKVWSCFKGLHEQSQKEMAELQAEQQAYMEGKGVELALSDDDVEPDFGQVPNSSDEDEVDDSMALTNVEFHNED